MDNDTSQCPVRESSPLGNRFSHAGDTVAPSCSPSSYNTKVLPSSSPSPFSRPVHYLFVPWSRSDIFHSGPQRQTCTASIPIDMAVRLQSGCQMVRLSVNSPLAITLLYIIRHGISHHHNRRSSNRPGDRGCLPTVIQKASMQAAEDIRVSRPYLHRQISTGEQWMSWREDLN